MTVSVTIRIHAQLGIVERERRFPSWNRKDGQQRRTKYEHKRSWSNSSKDRHNGGYAHFGPGWLLPRVMETVTGSIVWGIYGRMADMPEY